LVEPQVIETLRSGWWMTIVEALQTADAAQTSEPERLREALAVLAAAYRDVTIGGLAREETRRWTANPQRTN
jgi:hypothetical protein